MAQGTAGFNILSNYVKFADTASIDAFSRLRVSNPTYLFDAQFTHDLQPLLFEQITNGSGATITHNATDRMANMNFSSTPTGGQAIMQSYEWIRYQPGRAQLFFVTFNMQGGTANVLKFAGIGDGNNGITFELDGTTAQVALRSDSSVGDNVITQLNWNLDKLNGTGPSGITLDTTKTQILVLDFQALYVGRVRIGFDIDGQIIFCHEFKHANIVAFPYIQNASLPIRVGMTCTGTVTSAMNFICSSAISEGGELDKAGYTFAHHTTGTAGNGTDAHIITIRPKTTFNSISNRTKLVFDSLDMIVTGTNSVKWSLLLGQNLSGTTTFTDVNSTYSAFEWNTAGTLNGAAAITLASGFVYASTQSKTTTTVKVPLRYPITLNAAGENRDLGQLTLVAEGFGGTSALRAILSWHEIR